MVLRFFLVMVAIQPVAISVAIPVLISVVILVLVVMTSLSVFVNFELFVERHLFQTSGPRRTVCLLFLELV